MREERKTFLGREALQALLFVLLVFAAVFTLDLFSFISHAESQGKVTVQSAKIRQQPTTKSDAIGGAASNQVITVTGKIQGTDDNYIWYQVLTEDQKVGYIRSDLLTITSGGEPPALNADGTVANPTETHEAGVFVPVQPVSTTVTGTSQARVRAGASSSATLLKTAETGLTLTVTGYEYDAEGNLWYKVKYSTNNEEVTGFIRSDYLAVQKEELSPADETPAADPQPQDNPAQDNPAASTEIKDYDTMIKDGEWMLVDNTQDPVVGWPIKKLLEANEENTEKLKEVEAASKKKSTGITLCVIIIIALLAVIAIGFIKMRDMVDEADMLAAEKANSTRRNADRPQFGRNPAKSGTQPASKTVQPGKAAPGSRPVQQNEVKKAPPAGANSQNKTMVPVKPEKVPARPNPGQQTKPQANQDQQVKKPRNIMDDNDDFEFEFLNKKD